MKVFINQVNPTELFDLGNLLPDIKNNHSTPNDPTPDHPTLPQLLSPKEVSKLLKISLSMVYKLAEAGKIPYVTIGRGKRFKVDDVFKYIEYNTHASKVQN